MIRLSLTTIVTMQAPAAVWTAGCSLPCQQKMSKLLWCTDLLYGAWTGMSKTIIIFDKICMCNKINTTIYLHNTGMHAHINITIMMLKTIIH